MDKVRELISPLRAYVPTITKALVGFLAGTVLSYLARHGIEADMTVGEAVRSSADGLVTGFLVWVFPNRD